MKLVLLLPHTCAANSHIHDTSAASYSWILNDRNLNVDWLGDHVLQGAFATHSLWDNSWSSAVHSFTEMKKEKRISKMFFMSLDISTTTFSQIHDLTLMLWVPGVVDICLLFLPVSQSPWCNRGVVQVRHMFKMHIMTFLGVSAMIRAVVDGGTVCSPHQSQEELKKKETKKKHVCLPSCDMQSNLKTATLSCVEC